MLWSLYMDMEAQSTQAKTVSPVQVPGTQVMERPGDIAHDRIPASVFESKPSTPTAWSAVSNESLFSIQIGNLSFSRDQFLTMTEDKFDELVKSGELRKSAELIWSRLHNESPIGKLRDTNEFDMGKKYEEKVEILKDSANENFDQLKHGVPQVEGSRDPSTNYSQQSDESGIGCQPLAFPKKKKSGRVGNAALCGKAAAVVGQAAAVVGQAIAVTGQDVAVTGQAVVASGQAADITGQAAALIGQAAALHGQAAVVVNGQAAVAVNGLDHSASFSVQASTAVLQVLVGPSATLGTVEGKSCVASHSPVNVYKWPPLYSSVSVMFFITSGIGVKKVGC
ncbi:hypothetical protein POM88_046473 [Heracleum sosnowskyi]|uniref:Uncharacterized protein n=1 Tax=Heracleum sosnowskyi TaxID=360622 RepID=A0AAD8M6Z2_9APIA|nr:hypothetical protein POM88_046473 [Heracleum sosnowskyi]